MIAIGDIHGKVEAYYKILQKHKNHSSIQVGDFGFKKQHDWHLKHIDNNLHTINFGNHDYYPYINEPHSCGNFSYDPKLGLATARGAKSIDVHLRTQGVDWFTEEEMSYAEMQAAIDAFITVKPKIMVTHECPFDVSKNLFGYDDKTITKQGLQAMFEQHQPELWIFGHYHKSKNEVINGTRFVCLAELETLII